MGLVLLLSRSLLGPEQDIKLRPCWFAGVHADLAVLFVLVLKKEVNCSLCWVSGVSACVAVLFVLGLVLGKTVNCSLCWFVYPPAHPWVSAAIGWAWSVK